MALVPEIPQYLQVTCEKECEDFETISPDLILLNCCIQCSSQELVCIQFFLARGVWLMVTGFDNAVCIEKIFAFPHHYASLSS